MLAISICLAILAASSIGSVSLAAAQAPTELTILTWAGQEMYETIGARFTEEYPNIKVRVELVPIGQYFDKAALLTATDQAPDLILSNPQNAAMMIKSVWMPLDEFVKSYKFDFSQYIDSSWAYGRKDGKLWAWPSAINPPYPATIYAYNVDIINQAGFGDEMPYNWSFAEFLKLAQRTTIDTNGDGVPEQWGTNIPNRAWWWDWVWANDGDILTPDLKKLRLLEQEAVEGLQFNLDLNIVHKVAISSGVPFFAQGKIATTNQALPTVLNQNAKQPFPFDWRIAPNPFGRVGKPVARGGDLPLGINRDSENAEAAWLFLQYMARKEIQSWATFDLNLMSGPYHRGVVLTNRFAVPREAPHTMMPVITQQTKYQPLLERWVEFDALVISALNRAAKGEVDVMRAFREIETSLLETLTPPSE